MPATKERSRENRKKHPVGNSRLNPSATGVIERPSGSTEMDSVLTGRGLNQCSSVAERSDDLERDSVFATMDSDRCLVKATSNAVQTKRSRSARKANPLVLVFMAFLTGLLFCQILSAQEPAKHVPQSKAIEIEPIPLPDRSTLPAPAEKFDIKDFAPLKMEQLGGEKGFGNGQPIGSGLAEIVVENNAPKPLAPVAPPEMVTPETKKSNPLKPLEVAQLPVTKTPKAPSESASAASYREMATSKPSRIMQQISDAPISFSNREQATLAPCEVVPQPLGYGEIYDPEKVRQTNPWHPNPRKDEVVLNGGDLGKKATVDPSWNVYNLNPGDTIGHFDTLDGKRLVTESNRVPIYAPRFAAVRSLDGVINAESRQKVGSMNEKKVLNMSESKDFSTTTKQNLGVDRFQGTKRASGLRENLRGVTSDNLIRLYGTRNSYETFENLSLFRFGRHQNSESPRLGLGMQSANVWQDNAGLQVAVKGAQPVVVNDVYKVQQIVRIDSDDKQAILRVAKVASKVTARAGENVDFTIRFDNLTGRPIGNVTIIDSLSSRLDYVADSAECSVKADFKFERNEVGSLVLRWEIVEPLAANTGGIIRFRCRVQ